MYTPDDFGTFAIKSASAAIMAVFKCMRYENFITAVQAANEHALLGVYAAVYNHLFEYLGNKLRFKARIITAISCLTIVGFDVHYVTVGNWIRRYEESGKQGIELGKRDRRIGEDRVLSSAQETKLINIICDKSPMQMKLSFALWTSAVIQDLIWNLWHKRVARRTINTYMKRWGFTPQKPAKRAYEQCSKKV